MIWCGRQTREQMTIMTEAFQASQPERRDHSRTKTILEQGTLSITTWGQEGPRVQSKEDRQVLLGGLQTREIYLHREGDRTAGQIQLHREQRCVHVPRWLREGLVSPTLCPSQGNKYKSEQRNLLPRSLSLLAPYTSASGHLQSMI